MNIGDYILLPKNTTLTEIGISSEKAKGNFIQLSKYKIVDIFWEEVFYPYPHSTKRISLKKGAGITYVRYAETIINILSILN